MGAVEEREAFCAASQRPPHPSRRSPCHLPLEGKALGAAAPERQWDIAVESKRRRAIKDRPYRYDGKCCGFAVGCGGAGGTSGWAGAVVHWLHNGFRRYGEEVAA